MFKLFRRPTIRPIKATQLEIARIHLMRMTGNFQGAAEYLHLSSGHTGELQYCNSAFCIYAQKEINKVNNYINKEMANGKK